MARPLHLNTSPQSKGGEVVVVSSSSAVGEAMVRSLNLAGGRALPLDQTSAISGTRSVEPALAILIASDLATAAASVSKLKRLWHAARILVVGVDNREEAILRCLASGAHGVVTADESLDELRLAIKDVLADQLRTPPRLIRPLLDRLVLLDRGTRHSGKGPPLARLSAREIEILSCLSHGETNKDIAVQLHLEIQTVKNHVSHVLHKLGVATRFDAARVGARCLRSRAGG